MDKIRSWEYDTNKKIAIKTIDKSGFNRGSHIPIKVREIFNCTDVEYGKPKFIKLKYKGKEFGAFIEKEKNNKIRIIWTSILPILKDKFKEVYTLLENGEEVEEYKLPKIEFKREEKDFKMKLHEGDITNIKEYIKDSNIYNMKPGEVIDTIIKKRKHQENFRKALIHMYGKCKICNIKNESLLVASHIKEWSKSNSYEKTDRFNGFLLCPNHDSLFDKHLITFDDNGEIIISKELSNEECNILGIKKGLKIDLKRENKKYLKFHREEFYKKEEEKNKNKRLDINEKEIEKYIINIK